MLTAAAVAFVVIVLAVGVAFRSRPLAMLARGERWALRHAGLRSDVVASALGPIRYFRGGSGPGLVLLHGAGDQAGTWSRVAPALLAKYDVIVPDLPGHGDSVPHDGPLPMGTILEGFETLLEKAVPPAPCILVGNSLGAWIAALYAHRHPERVARLVLVNGGPVIGDRPDLSLMPKNREEARRALDATRCPESRRIPDYIVDDIIRQARQGPIARMAAAAATIFPYLLEGRLGEIRVPVDLLWGECDQLMSMSYANRMLAGLPAARLTTLPKGGHVPQRGCPKDLVAALMDLLQKPAPQSKAN